MEPAMAAIPRIWNYRPAAMLCALAATLVAAATMPSQSADVRPDYRPAAYAIRGARVVPVSSAIIESGTVVVRNGVIESVGPADSTMIPFDAEIIDGSGMVVYPGFLDAYTTLGVPATAVRSLTGAGRAPRYEEYAYASTAVDNRNGITPEFDVSSAFELADDAALERRRLGFTDIVAAPGGAIAAGQSALATTTGVPRREAVVKAPVGLHLSLRPPVEPTPPPNPDDNPALIQRRGRPGGAGGSGPIYPTSLMGVVAHLRQAMLDAEHNHEALAYYEKFGGARPPHDPALKALYAAKHRALPVWWEANTRDEIHRALDLAEEFGTDAVIVGGREAWKVADRLKQQDVPVVLRLDFPDETKPPTEAEYRKKAAADRTDSLRVLNNRHAVWKERVANAAALAKAGVRFSFSSDGVTKADTFHTKVRTAISNGLSVDAAVAALTQRAAEIAGVGSRLGTIEKGKLGHLVVMTGNYDGARSRVRYLLADGLKFDLDKDRPAAGGASKKRFGGGAAEGKTKGAETRPAGKPEEDEPPKDDPAKTKAEPPKDQPKTKDEPKKEAEPPAKAEVAKTEAAKPEAPKTEAAKNQAANVAATAPKTPDDQPPSTPFVDISSELEADRKPAIQTGGNVLIKDVTILTVAEAGTISKGSILVRDGKIAAIGQDIPAPEGCTVIDGTGLVAMPGIIDTHSHMAIQGGVNEMSLSIVPEVRVRDVVDGNDPTIYRALAGGTTTARLLHGSANTIGGQDVVIKLRQGKPGRDLILKDDKRPQGVKFALGENVTRRTGRFPNTRMGVEATIERAFDEARVYRAEWDAYNKSKGTPQAGPPPRKDLKLEALAEILSGSYKIHSHCYRLDEILMLLRVASRYGVRVQSLQHVLEGYKVAPEIAAHGASASTFSDWWAYKIEAFDAIPFNAALLTEAGVRVCIKSDSEELVRHLYLEAAKMVKYGAVPEAKALEMITINPARELGLEHRVGSIEVGKDADIAIFNGHPFDGYSRCELALVDGEVTFQRKEAEGKFGVRPGNHITAPLASADARARVLDIPADPKGVYALLGATLHPVSGPEIKDGVLIVSNGKISAIGGAETPIPGGAQSVDLKGLDVWPGMVDAGNIIGVFEVGSLTETQDYRDSAQFQPELRTSTALHPDSELIPVTRANGVLASFVQPMGGTISGQGCVMEMAGWVPSEMVVADRVALSVGIPTAPSTNPEGGRGRFAQALGDPAEQRRRRDEQLDGIREEFHRALAYDKVRSDALQRKAAVPPHDPRLEALVPYAKGEKPVFFRAERALEILDAIKLTKDLKLKGVVTGGAEAWKVGDELKAAKMPVVIAGTLRIPLEATDPYDAHYANAAKLFAAGVTLAFRSQGQGADQGTAARNLPYEAATAVAFGLPEAEALKAVTMVPAQILGVDKQLGSLDVGKRANLVITAGGLLQPTTEVKALFVAGKPMSPESRHTKLYAKFRQRLAEVKAGTAPLGLENSAVTSAPKPMPISGTLDTGSSKER
jgi:imidazolonepropionase-like amidohydrolase